jgi:hypothetical protein
MSFFCGAGGSASSIIISRRYPCSLMARDAIKGHVGRFRMCLGACRAVVILGCLRRRCQQLSTRRHLGEKKRPSEKVPTASLPIGSPSLASEPFNSRNLARFFSTRRRRDLARHGQALHVNDKATAMLPAGVADAAPSNAGSKYYRNNASITLKFHVIEPQ